LEENIEPIKTPNASISARYRTKALASRELPLCGPDQDARQTGRINSLGENRPEWSADSANWPIF